MLYKQLAVDPNSFRMRKHKFDENYEIKLDRRGVHKVLANQFIKDNETPVRQDERDAGECTKEIELNASPET